MDGPERFCPACGDAIEDDDASVFFDGEMYHVACAPGASTWPPPPRQPRWD
jgi:hypothetical protein